MDARTALSPTAVKNRARFKLQVFASKHRQRNWSRKKPDQPLGNPNKVSAYIKEGCLEGQRVDA